MIDRELIDSILEQYKKHGWKLRRVLLSGQLRADYLETADEGFDGVHVKNAAIDAAWFSRSSRPGSTAWELRHLSAAPYALLETFRDDAGTDEIEQVLARTEERLLEAVSRRKLNEGNSLASG